MQKKFKPSGNGWEFYLSKPLLKLLGYDPKETKLLVKAKNKVLTLTPIKPADVEKNRNNMVRNIQKSGCSYGIYFPAPLLEILEINPEEDSIDVQIDDNKLIFKKCE